MRRNDIRYSDRTRNVYYVYARQRRRRRRPPEIFAYAPRDHYIYSEQFTRFTPGPFARLHVPIVHVIGRGPYHGVNILRELVRACVCDPHRRARLLAHGENAFDYFIIIILSCRNIQRAGKSANNNNNV